MTRILVQRGSVGSSSNRPSLPVSSSNSTPLFSPPVPSIGHLSSAMNEEQEKELRDSCALDEFRERSASGDDKLQKNDEISTESIQGSRNESDSDECIEGRVKSPRAILADQEKACNEDMSGVGEKVSSGSESNLGAVTKELVGPRIPQRSDADENDGSGVSSSKIVPGSSYPPPPPVPPPRPSAILSSRRTISGGSNAVRIGSSRRPTWPVVLTRTSPSGSRPSSPRSHGESEGYNSADEQNPCFGSSYNDAEKERLFELDIRRTKGLEVKKMLEDGNCLFRAVADQVYGDTEVFDLTRQMCIDYMERERDHFSQFITEGFTSYCKRKRRDKVYGNNLEIQALSEMYNRPIHIYSYSTEPINIFHGSYDTDTPPIRLSYHHGNHYNSLVDPRRLTIGAGLGFSSLQGANIDKDQVKAAIKAQQDQQIENALLAEGRFYSDLELTEKEIERMVMEASRTEYLAEDKFNQRVGFRESSTSGAEPSSSGARPPKLESGLEKSLPEPAVLSNSMQIVLSMGFSYLQVIEAYSIFGDDVDSMVCYLLEMGGGGTTANRRKGKATE